MTVDLDVLVRADLIEFLVQESQNRRATIVCKPICLKQSYCGKLSVPHTDATHIFDGLSAFPSHICHLRLGSTPTPLYSWQEQGSTEDLFLLALKWLREDRDFRRVKEEAAGRVRGPKEDVSINQKIHAVADVFAELDEGCQDLFREVRLRALGGRGRS